MVVDPPDGFARNRLISICPVDEILPYISSYGEYTFRTNYNAISPANITNIHNNPKKAVRITLLNYACAMSIVESLG